MAGYISDMNLDYNSEVIAILALDGDGERLMPLAMERCSSEAARERLRTASAARPTLWSICRKSRDQWPRAGTSISAGPTYRASGRISLSAEACSMA